MATPEEVTAKATQLADELINEARTLEGPVIWVTGNRYMPPMRSFPSAEEVWDLDDADLWELFCETVESKLTEADVTMESPDYDNALYVVDLRRWSYNENAEGDDLNDDWERITDTGE